MTHIGDLFGLELSSGSWSVDSNKNNKIVEIVGVQDAAGNNLGDPNVLAGTGVWALFRFI
jgi:hypothetical protein